MLVIVSSMLVVAVIVGLGLSITRISETPQLQPIKIKSEQNAYRRSRRR
jgi:hypothetical protein